METDILEGWVGGGEVGTGTGSEDDEVRCILEGQINLNIVIHQSDQRKRKAGVAVEPEDQRDEQGLRRDGRLLFGKILGVSDHDLVTDLLCGGLSELVVNVVPETVVLVNDGTTDFNRDLINDELTNVAGPGDGVSDTGNGQLGELDLEETFVNKVSIASNQ